MRRNNRSTKRAEAPKTLRVGSRATVRVPMALMSYLARRCDAPDRVISGLLRLMAPGRSHPISSAGDIHLELEPCVLQATTVVTARGQDVEACIVGKDWMVHASPHSTDLTLAHLSNVARASLGRGLLHEKFDFAFLPRELEIEEIVERGPGVRIRCQSVVTDVEVALRNTAQGLDDVWGAVSGSDSAS